MVKYDVKMIYHYVDKTIKYSLVILTKRAHELEAGATGL